MTYPKLEDLNSGNCPERSMKKHYPEFWKYLTDTYPNDITWTEKLYWFYNGLTEHPKCKCCGKPTVFINLKKGYREYCSYKCLNSDPDKKEQTKNTCIQRYGGIAPACGENVKKKMKETSIKKYGVEYAMNLQSTRDKAKKTMEERYGGCGNASIELKKKYKNTSLERYGVENYASTPECRDKMAKTNLERYGAEQYTQTEDFRNKIISRNLEKYGVNSYTQTDEYKEKTLRTNLEKYGVEHYSMTDEFKERTKQTCMERYGCENIMHLDGIKEKIKEGYMDHYGTEHFAKSKEFYEKLPSILEKSNQTKRENGTFNTSQIEENFASWLTSQGIEYKRQYNSKDYPFNSDFYIPSQDLYIEIQGSWTHGGHPYGTRGDSLVLEHWKKKAASGSDFYANAIDVWTRRDPLKRQWAKEHKLNWIEMFSNDIDEIIKAYKDHGNN